jgi:hypothetical protein
MNATSPNPVSSSQVRSRLTLNGSATKAIAVNAWTTPAFMSNTPGPLATPSRTVNGQSVVVPSGHTVSKCPKTSTVGTGARHSRCGSPSRTTRRPRRRRAASPHGSRRSAQVSSAAGAPDGDSHVTSAASLPTMASACSCPASKRSCRRTPRSSHRRARTQPPRRRSRALSACELPSLARTSHGEMTTAGYGPPEGRSSSQPKLPCP